MANGLLGLIAQPQIADIQGQFIKGRGEAQTQATFERQERARGLAGAALQTQLGGAAGQVALEDPDLAINLFKATNVIGEARQKQFAEDVRVAAGLSPDPVQTLSFLDQTIARNEQQGIPSPQIRQFREEFAQDPVRGAQTLQQFSSILQAPKPGAAQFQKGKTVLTKQDGQLGFATSAFSPATGGTETSFTPITGELVSTLGETPTQQTQRKVEEVVKTESAKAGVELRTKPVISAAVEKAVADVKATFETVAGQRSNELTFTTYTTAMKGLADSLAGTDTGPWIGWSPALTSNQQIAEGAIAAMAPVLKDIFRGAGEGTFTEGDQKLLIDMLPTRKDSPKARIAKISSIDAIVRSKLQQPPGSAPGQPPAPEVIPTPVQQPPVVRFDRQGRRIQ